MATAVYVTFAYARNTRNRENPVDIRRKASTSQKLTAAGTTSISAPISDGGERGQPTVTVRAVGGPILFAVGGSPAASNTTGTGDSASDYLADGEVITLYCDYGDKVNYIEA